MKKNKIIIKLLDNEILLYKKDTIYKEQTTKFMDNNFITNYKELNTLFKTIFNKYKLTNLVFQNKIYILINKLYCETNIFIISNILYSNGFSNYNFIYEEDLYKNIFPNILSLWNNTGILLLNDKEYYIDIENKKDLIKLLIPKKKILLITTSNIIRETILKINPNIILYEDDDNPIFTLLINTFK